MSIAVVLNALYERRTKIAEIDDRISKVAANLLAERAAIEAEAKALEAQAKSKAKYIPESKAHTLLGRFLQLVWTKPQPVWDEACLKVLAEKYGIAWDEFQACGKVDRPGYWSIRNRAQS